MKKQVHYCTSCQGEEEFLDAGLVPVDILFSSEEEEDSSPYWIRASVCTECGSVDGDVPQEGELRRAEDRIVDILTGEGIITEEEAKAALGL